MSIIHNLSSVNSDIYLSTLTHVLWVNNETPCLWKNDIFLVWWINPSIKANGLRRTKEADIIEKKYYVIDLDVRKYYKEQNNTIMTDTELSAWLSPVKDKMLAHPLFSQWRHIVNSWNGFHIRFILENPIPINNDNKKIIRDNIVRLNNLFEREILDGVPIVDKATMDLWRLWRMPGSINTKCSQYWLPSAEVIIVDEQDTYFNPEEILRKAPLQKPMVAQARAAINRQVPIGDIVAKNTWLQIASDGINFVWGNPWYKAMFVDKKWENKLIAQWSPHLWGAHGIYSPREYIVTFMAWGDEEKAIQICMEKYPSLFNAWFEKINIKQNIDEVANLICDTENILCADEVFFKYSDCGIRKKSTTKDIQHITYNYVKNIAEKPRETNPNMIKTIVDMISIGHHNKDILDSLKKVSQFDLCLEDGIYCLQNNSLRPYRKEEYKTHKLPYHSELLSTTIDTPIWFSFLDSILEWHSNKQAIIEFLQEYIGYLFIPWFGISKWLLIHWSWGNGKWVLLEVIKELIWTNNCSNIWLWDINNPTYKIQLLWKLVNIDSEMRHNVQLDDAAIKQIISHEETMGRLLYEQAVAFKPYCRLISATNTMPYIKSHDNSIKRRFIFLELKASFVWKEDHKLIDKILSEKDWIFIRAIEWLKRLLERGYFSIPAELQQAVDEFVDSSDSFKCFMEDVAYTENPKLTISAKDLYIWYSCYCKDNGYFPLSMGNLRIKLASIWINQYRRGWGKYYKGIDIIR